jgi:hypothetical protein
MSVKDVKVEVEAGVELHSSDSGKKTVFHFFFWKTVHW